MNRGSKRLRALASVPLRPVIFITVGALCALVILYGCVDFGFEHSSTRLLVSEQSPDGAWTATLTETVHEYGLAAADVFDELRLTSRHNATADERVLSVGIEGNEPQPRISWIESNLLRVTVDNQSYVAQAKLSFLEVALDLRFEPDDP